MPNLDAAFRMILMLSWAASQRISERHATSMMSEGSVHSGSPAVLEKHT